ncbi:MAG: mechanosensitive ion channel, partial [Deltaproteobacteria bacterium]|nr:mechanosensitive ion channel [Deltaproteobacteria bacterium]
MDHLTTLFNRHPWLELLIERGIKVILIIAVVVVCAKLIHNVCKRILEEAHKAKLGGSKDAHEREKRLATVVRLIDTTLRVILYAFGFLMILRELGLDITPFLTGAGIAGVALGFGSQSLVKDMISGFFLLIEDQIRVGDVIKINSGLSGSVERMELRVTAIRVRLLGAYHDGFIELFYSRVIRYSLSSPSSVRGLGDWLYDEFRVAPGGHLIHEIEWAGFPRDEGSRWIIEASDV